MQWDPLEIRRLNIHIRPLRDKNLRGLERTRNRGLVESGFILRKEATFNIKREMKEKGGNERM
jgi:hypothetical protein